MWLLLVLLGCEAGPDCVDMDGDGYGDGAACVDEDCDDHDPDVWICGGEDDFIDADRDGADSTEDCDDTDPAVHPGADEVVYNGVDDDCDPGTLDDDLDADGHVVADDCDDEDGAVHPGAAEVAYNGVDDDCDGSTPDDDLDADGHVVADDCDDEDAAVHPDAAEVAYNGVDDDCDASTPDDDLDADGHVVADDCDDSDAAVHPGASEDPYNGVDDDCDASTPDDDLDADGYVLVDDCDDTDAAVHPGAVEILDNGIDDDCDAGTADVADRDGDGVDDVDDCSPDDPGIYPGAPDLPDLAPDRYLDEDCDGSPLPAADDEWAVFVSVATGSDVSGDGTKAKPFATIGRGVTEAEAAGKTWVMVGEGTYAESVTLTSVSLMGGWTTTFSSWDAGWAPVRLAPASGPGVRVSGATERLVLASLFQSSGTMLELDGAADVGAIGLNGSGLERWLTATDSALTCRLCQGGTSGPGATVSLTDSTLVMDAGALIASESDDAAAIEGGGAGTSVELLGVSPVRAAYAVRSVSPVGSLTVRDANVRGRAGGIDWQGDVSVTGGLIESRFATALPVRPLLRTAAGTTLAIDGLVLRSDKGPALDVGGVAEIVDAEVYADVGGDAVRVAGDAVIAHSVLRGPDAVSGTSAALRVAGGTADVWNTLLLNVDDVGTRHAVHLESGSEIGLHGVWFSNQPVGVAPAWDCLVEAGGVCTTDIAGVSACGFAGCVAAESVSFGDADGYDSGGGYVPRSSSPLIDGGLDASDVVGAEALEADIDGYARPLGGGPDIGPYEVE